MFWLGARWGGENPSRLALPCEEQHRQKCGMGLKSLLHTHEDENN